MFRIRSAESPLRAIFQERLAQRAHARAGEHASWYLLPSGNRKIMKDRAAHIKAPRDFNRPYRDIVDRHRQWTMEEWIHFVEAWSPYVLSTHPKLPGGNVLHDERLQEMWGLLRAVTLHYCRATPGNGTPAKQKEAHDMLMRYAKLVSQHFGIKACTYNLHLLCCR